ncbi:MAG: hybrid sensor histidine kinase/response regulator [Actinomycetota bacterium]
MTASKTISTGGANVLLVDDRPENLLALEDVLRPLGYNLIRAASGEEALKRLLKDDFALILLDVQMPGVDGFETAAHVRQLEKTRDVPIIFLTAISNEAEHRMQGYSLGAFDYVFKPFEPAELRSKVGVLVELYEKKELLKEQAKLLSKQLEEQTRLNRALDEFAGWVAHDLRSPLSVIKGAVEAIGDLIPRDDGKADRLLGMVDKSIRRANDLVSGLLELARASGTPRPETIPMKELVDDVIGESEGLDVETGPLPYEIVADRIAVRQALANLVSNARNHASAEGVAQVTISAESTREGWTLCVADRGPGLPKEGVTEVFEPFRRGTDIRHAGTGLGLAIVAATAEAHGGRAWYEPRRGGGSCFYFSIADPSTRPSTTTR